jgi:hypothetical protein
VGYAVSVTNSVRQKYSRSSLNSGQIAILELLYKYRFGSRQLLANSLGIKAGSSLHTKLEVLRKHGYIDKRLEKRLKLYGVPAAYHLLPKGIRALQALPEHDFITEQAIRANYKDKTVSNDFIAHTLSVYERTQLLQARYPALKVFTKRDMGRYSYFPEQPPDAFLSLLSDDPKQPHRFFLDVVSDKMPRYLLDKRIAAYCTFFEEGGWDETGSALPVILLLSEWPPAEKRIQRSIAGLLNRLEADVRVYTTTTTALERADADEPIWTAVDDVDELVTIEAITVNP